MKIDLDNETETPSIEIVPLIDILFCILVFFLLTAFHVTRYQAIQIAKQNLPQSNASVPQITPRLVISLDENRQVYIDGKFSGLLPQLTSSPKSQQRFLQTLQTSFSQNPYQQAVLYAPKTASYSDVLQTLDLLKLALGDRVALGTLPGSK